MFLNYSAGRQAGRQAQTNIMYLSQPHNTGLTSRDCKEQLPPPEIIQLDLSHPVSSQTYQSFTRVYSIHCTGLDLAGMFVSVFSVIKFVAAVVASTAVVELAATALIALLTA